MIGKILSGILNSIILTTQLVLAPIDLFISNTFPDLSNGLDYVANLFSYINNVIGYAIDASGISDIALFLVVSYWVTVIGATVTISTIKSALKWYNILKP